MLSPRLQTAADLVLGPRHADIGSDHGLLPLDLMTRFQRVIAVEKHAGPFEHCCRAVGGTPVEVRFGDGLDPLQAGEIDSLSICGMGSLNIRAILERGREKLPDQLVLQPMDNAGPIRGWARRNGFHLQGECWVDPYVVLELRAGSGEDPAYIGLPEEAEFFGPFLLSNPAYVARQIAWLEGLGRPDGRLEFLQKHTSNRSTRVDSRG